MPGAGDRKRRSQRADTAARHQHAVPIRAQVQNVLGKRGDEHRIRPAENSDHGEERKNGEDAPVAPDITKAFQGLADRARVALDLRLPFRQPHQEEPADDGDEAEAIEQETHGDADLRHEETGNRRADDAGAVERGTVERDGVHQIFAAGHLDHERLPRRHVERHRDASEDGEHDDLPRLDQLAPNERGHRERHQHLARLRNDDHRAFRITIGHPAAPRGEEKHRRGGGRGDETEQHLRPGELINEPALRGRGHPRSGERDELAGKEEAEIPMLEGSESFSERDAAGGHAPGPARHVFRHVRGVMVRRNHRGERVFG